MTPTTYKVPTLAELTAEGKEPEILFWVGCAGSFDDRYKAVTIAFVKILNAVGINFAVLGPEENCTGDPARRAGNDFLFQMQRRRQICRTRADKNHVHFQLFAFDVHIFTLLNEWSFIFCKYNNFKLSYPNPNL